MKRDLQLDLATAAAVSPASNARQWRYALLLLALVAAGLLVWYAGTVKSMTDIYARNETFAHGYIVPVISGWLIWRQREELAALTPHVWWAPIALVPVMGFIWLVGDLASANALSQFALTALLILSVITVVGREIARKLAFPLAFLFFAVPVGEIFLPYLMTWTADFTVAALRVSGIPVYREGQQLMIPSGVWSVVEACSGLRYLIASFMVGTLFAHVIYRSTKRRLVFIVVAILVPIVANWLRAYMIVMLGHLSGNKLAVGVDHLIYGWVFFAVVIASLFAVAARWREDHLLQPPIVTGPTTGIQSTSVSRLWIAAGTVFLLATMWKLGSLEIQHLAASAPVRLITPTVAAPWEHSPAPFEWRPHFVNPAAEFEDTFTNGHRAVGVFVAYYRDQQSQSKLVSSENRLVKNEDNTWLPTRVTTRTVTINGTSVPIRSTELRASGGQQLLVWQWYWIAGEVTTNDYWAKAYTAYARLTGRRDDSAAILIYTPQERAGTAEGTLTDFLRAAGPGIEASLRATREAR